MKFCDLLQEQVDSFRSGRDFAVVTIVKADQLARTSGKMIVYPGMIEFYAILGLIISIMLVALV